MRVPPDVIGVDDNPDGVSRELQGQVNGIAEPADRAPVGANIGCRASTPSRTPARCATGTSSAIPSAIIRRAVLLGQQASLAVGDYPSAEGCWLLPQVGRNHRVRPQ